MYPLPLLPLSASRMTVSLPVPVVGAVMPSWC